MKPAWLQRADIEASGSVNFPEFLELVTSFLGLNVVDAPDNFTVQEPEHGSHRPVHLVLGLLQGTFERVLGEDGGEQRRHGLVPGCVGVTATAGAAAAAARGVRR